MTVEQLMQPRFKLIFDYPGNTRDIGSISKEIATAEYFRRFPANFKELFWWENRNLSDLPEYVLYTKSANREIWKVSVWENSKVYGAICELRGGSRIVLPGPSCLIPATAEEYNQYINQLK